MNKNLQPVFHKITNWRDFPVSSVNDTQIIRFGPEIVRGNHRHPRQEWYLAIGDLILFWLDGEGKLQSFPLNAQSEPFLVQIPPFLPHAVFNQSASRMAILIEFSDQPQNNVERIVVFNIP